MKPAMLPPARVINSKGIILISTLLFDVLRSGRILFVMSLKIKIVDKKKFLQDILVINYLSFEMEKVAPRGYQKYLIKLRKISREMSDKMIKQEKRD